MTQASVRTGFRFVAVFMLMIVGTQLLRLLGAWSQGGLNLLGLFWFAATAFLCWSIYAGRMWARNVLAVLTFLGLLSSVLQIITVFSVGGVGLGLFSTALTLINVGAVCALFMYEPVQDYFRYIGGDA